MSHNFPRIPTFLQNLEFAKSWYKDVKGATDYKPVEKIPCHPTMENQYRTPPDRVNGNELFRRYPDGTLDLEHAKHIVLDALEAMRHGGKDSLSGYQQAALCCVFPDVFDFLDPTMVESTRKVLCKVNKEECKKISVLVALHLNEQENWNAGLGGGSLTPRSVTKT